MNDIFKFIKEPYSLQINSQFMPEDPMVDRQETMA